MLNCNQYCKLSLNSVDLPGGNKASMTEKNVEWKEKVRKKYMGKIIGREREREKMKEGSMWVKNWKGIKALRKDEREWALILRSHACAVFGDRDKQSTVPGEIGDFLWILPPYFSIWIAFFFFSFFFTLKDVKMLWLKLKIECLVFIS